MSSRTRRSGRPRSAACRRATSARRREHRRHLASGCSRRCCRASTSRTRRRRPPCQVNNLHLLRGMIGRPGAGVLQMNGQPTAQNTRETRRRRRPAGLPQLGQPGARRASSPSSGTSTRSTIPHWAPPTHAMQIFRYAEQGSIGLLWISATNPAVSLPELRARSGGSSRDERAVRRRPGPLPDRDRASSPTWCCRRRPGARRPAPSPTPTARCTCPRRRSSRPARRAADLDIFLDYARRMDFRDRDGEPLITLGRPRGGVRGLEGVLAGPPVRLHRPDLRRCCAAAAASSGRARRARPEGTERLYADGVFNTDPDYCETLRPRPADRRRTSADGVPRG